MTDNKMLLGKRMLITGGGSGIGLETSRLLARSGADVVIADRDEVGGQRAVEQITGEGGRAEYRRLDLADLEGIRQFAAEELSLNRPLDVLVNNAGILPPKERATTRDGFELEFGIAHLGHFALTGLLFPALRRAANPRVVNVSSLSHTSGEIDFDDLQFEKNYSSTRSYTSTKLACLVFAIELNRRALACGDRLISVAAHPGVSRTPIAQGWQSEDRTTLAQRLELLSYKAVTKLMGQTAEQGAAPIVFAAVDPAVLGGGYYGPTGFGQMRGATGRVKPAPRAEDPALASRLWHVSEELTGVKYLFD